MIIESTVSAGYSGPHKLTRSGRIRGSDRKPGEYIRFRVVGVDRKGGIEWLGQGVNYNEAMDQAAWHCSAAYRNVVPVGCTAPNLNDFRHIEVWEYFEDQCDWFYVQTLSVGDMRKRVKRQ